MSYERRNNLLNVNSKNLRDVKEERRKKKPLRLVLNDGLDGVAEVLGRHEVEVHGYSGALGLHPHHVVGLVGEHGNAHHGYPVVDGLINAVGAAMSDEGSRLGMTWMGCWAELQLFA